MRILVVTSQYPIAGEPNRGRPLYQTIRELARQAEVRVVSPVATYPRWARPRSYFFRAPGADAGRDAGDVRYVAYPALPIVSRPFNGMSCARALATAAEGFAPDVVLSYWMYPDAYGAMRLARRLGVPLVAGARGSDLRVRDPLSRRLTRPVVRAAERLLVVSDDLAQVATDRYGADPQRIRTIHNGCDAAVFHPRGRCESRHALGIDADAELLVYVGRLVAAKGLRELLEACSALSAARPRLQLALVGEGPMRGELERMVAADRLPVRLVGPQPPAMVAQWMAASSLVTLPSHSEGHPNVLVEAMACGRPVVATRVGGIPEVVGRDEGVLVPVRDAGALARGLEQALDARWDEAAIGRKFSRDWSQVAAETLQACREAVAGHAAVATGGTHARGWTPGPRRTRSATPTEG
jgi:teichuronic acid biosynthesis glycosyltransferase TuaC